jgi:hypothetical protein
MATRPRLAAITTEYRTNSHSDVILSRWFEPLPTDREVGWPAAGHDKPRTEIASLFLHQTPENDTGRTHAAKHGVPVYETIREALTLGGDTLAVDGVLLIGEHGKYPWNEYFQHLYPRRELFDEIVAVFRETGRSVPVFNDKHLSYDLDSAMHMVATARELDFPLMAGSSIPLRDKLEHLGIEDGAELAEGMGLFAGGAESYGYHSIELLQSLIARRKGGESGIKSVTAYYGDSFWEAEAADKWSTDLIEAGFLVSRSAKKGHYRDNLTPPKPNATGPHLVPAAYCFEHSDGLKSSHLLLDGHHTDFIAVIREADGSVHSSGGRGSGGGAGMFFRNFAVFNSYIEEFMLTGKSPFPLDHYLLSTLAIRAAVRALATPGQRIETPELQIPYIIQS